MIRRLFLFLAVSIALVAQGAHKPPITLVRADPNRGIAARSARPAYLFVSACTEEHLDLPVAQKRLYSSRQRVFRRFLKEVVGADADPSTQVLDALGDWSDGIENSLLVRLAYAKDMAALRYASSQFGYRAGQKSVLVFLSDAAGADAVYELEISECDTGKVRQKMNACGIAFRTLIPLAHGHRILVFDEGQRLRNHVGLLAAEYGVPVHVAVGTGEFVGAANRAGAERIFQRLIASHGA